jgi:hypothetical protein
MNITARAWRVSCRLSEITRAVVAQEPMPHLVVQE